MSETASVYIGYDEAESLPYSVFSYSITSRSSIPLSVTPVKLSHLHDFYNRPRGPKDSTDFSSSRFLVPFLQGYRGWALYADCDMLMQDDISSLFALRNDQYAIQCVKHNHKPQEATKMQGQIQSRYSMKNWTSFMLMNCERLRTLTPDYVSSVSGLALHQFSFLESQELIGALPAGWNHLVGYDKTPPGHEIHNVHFTRGGPWWPDCRSIDEDWSERWEAELTEMRKGYL